MELILFNNYRKYQKEHKESFAKTIFKLPLMAVILLVIVFVSAATGAIFTFIASLRVCSWILLLIELLCCLGLYLYTERYLVTNSFSKLIEYREGCNKTYEWLKSCSVTPKESIYELNQRILSHINKLENELIHKRERMDKWMQILVIPIALAIFSAIIKAQTDIAIVMGYTLSLLFIFAFIYLFIFILMLIVNVKSTLKVKICCTICLYKIYQNKKQKYLALFYGFEIYVRILQKPYFLYSCTALQELSFQQGS